MLRFKTTLEVLVQTVSKVFFKLLRTAICLILLILAIFISLSLLLVFYVSPRLDQWREPIQGIVQKQTGMPIKFGALELSWRGLNPELIIKDIAFQESKLPTTAKQLPSAFINELHLFIQPSRAFWTNGLFGVAINHAQLPVIIDPEGDVWIGQHQLPLTDVSFSQMPEPVEQQHDDGELSFIATLSRYLTQDFGSQIDLLRDDEIFPWLAYLSVEDIDLSIRDASSFSTAELLSNVEQEVKDQSEVSYDFRLNLKKGTIEVANKTISTHVVVQSDMLSSSDLVIDSVIDYSQVDHLGGSRPSGHLRLNSSFIEPRQFFSNALDKFNIDQVVIEKFNFFSKLEDGHWKNFKADLQLTDFSMPQAIVEKISFGVEGDVADVLAMLFAYGHQHNPLQFTAQIKKGWLHETLNFRHDFSLDNIKLKGSYGLDDANFAVLSFHELEVRDPQVELNARGKWHAMPNNASGHIELEGEIHHLAASYLPRFLPKALEAQTLDWLDGAFTSGTLHNGRFLVNGLAEHYPYGSSPELGINQITADFKDFELDFHHQAEDGKWPALSMEHGTFRFVNDEILIDANRGWMDNLAGDKSIDYDNLHAIISSLEDDAMLHIDANAETTAENFLVFVKETPLNALLSYALDESEARGDLRAGLSIDIPLNDLESAKIDGSFYTHDAAFRLNPSFPKATDVSGSLSFNEKFLSINKLKAHVVGGLAELSGDIGRPGHSLTINGQFSGEGIYNAYPIKGLQQLKGQTPYNFEVKFLENNAFDAKLNSDLVGMAIDYPGLYIKPAVENTPLSMQWQRQRQRNGSYADQLVLNYDNDIAQFKADFSSGEGQDLMFKGGAIAFNQEPIAPEQGLSVQGSINQLEVESLIHWIDNFGFADGDDSNQLVEGFDVHVENLILGGFEFPYVTLQSRLEGFKRIPLVLSGPTVKGSLVLTESTDAVGLYNVDADFEHLQWRVNHKGGDVYADDVEVEGKELIVSDAEAPWKMNRLALKIKDLHFYKYQFENLEVSGEAEDFTNWRLDKLAIQDEYGHLYGAAYLHNKNEKLSTDLNFNINTIDMDALLKALSLSDGLLTGHGDIQGGLLVHDLLNFKPDDLEINVLGTLRDGHINNVSNGGTRLLSLLSLQALSKLPQMNKIFINQGTNSMNYSYLRFHLGLKGGRLWLPDFRLDSPLVGIAAQGHGNLRTDEIDLDVIAVPRLDMSGAAVLTGVLVNPAVGVAAFLSQWLLRSPMEQGLTQHIKIGGKLDALEVDGVPLDMNKSVAPKEGETRRIIEIKMPESMVDLTPEEQKKSPAPIIIEQGTSDSTHNRVGSY